MMGAIELIAVTIDIVQNLPVLRKAARPKLRQFATNVAVVALGIRSAYMVDAFSVKGHSTGDLLLDVLQALRKFPKYQNVTLLTCESLNDYFIVNAPLLLNRFHDEFSLGSDNPSASSDLPWTEFVKLVDPPRIIGVESVGEFKVRMLIPVFRVLRSVSEHQGLPKMPIRLDVPMSLPHPTDAIPLAAVLLEYPIAYVPGSAQTSFLANVPLDVYECNVAFDIDGSHLDHTILKFSCPSALTATQHPEYIAEKLHTRFCQRIACCGLSAEVIVKKHQVTFDRVAL